MKSSVDLWLWLPAIPVCPGPRDFLRNGNFRAKIGKVLAKLRWGGCLCIPVLFIKNNNPMTAYGTLSSPCHKIILCFSHLLLIYSHMRKNYFSFFTNMTPIAMSWFIGLCLWNLAFFNWHLLFVNVSLSPSFCPPSVMTFFGLFLLSLLPSYNR